MIIMNLNIFMRLTLNNGTYIGCSIMFPSLGGLLCQVVHQQLPIVLQQWKKSVSGNGATRIQRTTRIGKTIGSSGAFKSGGTTSPSIISTQDLLLTFNLVVEESPGVQMEKLQSLPKF
jgi:hypothetical protein